MRDRAYTRRHLTYAWRLVWLSAAAALAVAAACVVVAVIPNRAVRRTAWAIIRKDAAECWLVLGEAWRVLLWPET